MFWHSYKAYLNVYIHLNLPSDFFYPLYPSNPQWAVIHSRQYLNFQNICCCHNVIQNFWPFISSIIPYTFVPCWKGANHQIFTTTLSSEHSRIYIYTFIMSKYNNATIVTCKVTKFIFFPKSKYCSNYYFNYNGLKPNSGTALVHHYRHHYKAPKFWLLQLMYRYNYILQYIIYYKVLAIFLNVNTTR